MAGSRNVSQGEKVEIVTRTQTGTWRVDIIDGQEARITPTPNAASATGRKLQPGEYAIIEAPGRQRRFLHAVGSEITFELERQ